MEEFWQRERLKPNGLHYYDLAYVDERPKAEALEILDRLLEQDPQHPELLRRKAWLLIRTHRCDAAVDLLKPFAIVPDPSGYRAVIFVLYCNALIGAELPLVALNLLGPKLRRPDTFIARLAEAHTIYAQALAKTATPLAAANYLLTQLGEIGRAHV